MSDKKLIIADGHHRYETALNYGKEHAPAHVHHTRERDLASTLPHPPYPEAAVMMTFVNMDSDGLLILPTHRVVFDLDGFQPETFLERAAPFFEIENTRHCRCPAAHRKAGRRQRRNGVYRRPEQRLLSAEGASRTRSSGRWHSCPNGNGNWTLRSFTAWCWSNCWAFRRSLSASSATCAICAMRLRRSSR